MPLPLQSVTAAAASLALDAAQLRQQAIAANIANHQTPGFVPLRVDFEAQLAQARRDLSQTGELQPASLAHVKPQLAADLDATGQPVPVRLDEQMAALTDTNLRYHALARALSRHFSIVSLAVSDGKR